MLPVALALFSAACASDTRPVLTTAVAEAASLVAKRSTALRGNLDVTGITIETRNWNPVSGLPAATAAAATYNGLPTGVPGYTYPAVALPNVGTAPSVLITADGCALATPVRHPGTANTNIATRIALTLDVRSPSSIGIRFGVDARGAVVLVDGVAVASHMDDPSWFGYFLSDESDTDTPLWVTNPWGVIEVTPLDLTQGVHTIEVIGFEDGNDFGTGGQIDLGAGYQDIVGPIPQKNLTVSKIGGGTGSVASLPAGISCGTDCAEPFDFGTAVTLTAAATPPSVFAGWSGACSGMSTACTLTMDADRAVTAKFVVAPTVTAMTQETRFWLRSGPQPTVAGAAALFASLPTTQAGYTNAPVPVTSMVNNRALFTAPNVGADHDLATRTIISFTSAATAVLQMRAAVDYAAGGGVWLDGTWVTGVFGSAPGSLAATLNLSAGPHTIEILGFEDCCDGAPQLEFDYGLGWVQVTAPLPPPQRLTVTLGAAGGRIMSVPAGIDCGTLCVADYAAGSQVTLTVAVNPGFVFTGWSGGGCSGTGPCVVRMTSAQFVSANFRFHSLTVGRAGSGSGTVTSAPGGIDCGVTCSASFAEGTSVVLTAAPAAGSTFTGWTGACAGALPTCTVPMDAAKSVTATFAVQTFLLSVSKAGSGSGLVSALSAGINCGAMCTSTLTYGTTVNLAATASSGSNFAGWSGACSGTGSCTVTMTQARAVTATFRLDSDDTAPPSLSCKATPHVLWPVNHKLVPVKVQVTLTDASPATFRLVSVLSNEATNLLGDGTTSADIADWTLGTADVDGLLRAERNGTLRDRIYTLTYRGTDSHGNSATTSCAVTVPHDQR